MPKKGEHVKFKFKSPFIIYADLEIILASEDNEKQNPEELYASKYQKQIACSCTYKLVWVDDKFIELFKINLGKYVVYNFINHVIKESKYWSEVMKKHFYKELVMTKEDNKDFENSTKWWICDNGYVDNDVKVRDHCQIIRKYRSCTHRKY